MPRAPMQRTPMAPAVADAKAAPAATGAAAAAPHIEQFRRLYAEQAAGRAASLDEEMRAAALAELLVAGFPLRRDEEWIHTPLRAVAEARYRLGSAAPAFAAPGWGSELARELVAGEPVLLLTCNGAVAGPGVVAGVGAGTGNGAAGGPRAGGATSGRGSTGGRGVSSGNAVAATAIPGVRRAAWDGAPRTADTFTRPLATVFTRLARVFGDHAVLHCDAAAAGTPLHIVHLVEAGALAGPRVTIRIAPGARVTLVESCIAVDPAALGGAAADATAPRAAGNHGAAVDPVAAFGAASGTAAADGKTPGGAAARGATERGAAPNGATGNGAVPKQAAADRGAAAGAVAGAAPGGAAADGAAADGAAAGAAADGAAADGAAADGAAADGAAADGAAADGAAARSASGAVGAARRREPAPSRAASLSCADTEIRLGAGASLTYVRVQAVGTDAFDFGTTTVVQEQDSELHALSVALGGRIARHTCNVLAAAPGTNSRLGGATVAAGGQVLDHHTYLEHAAPGCASRQLYRTVLGRGGHAVFSGRILVRPLAQQTDAFQLNQNLLLGDARVDTKPQLEIGADDVRCTHGATTGRLNDDQLFYLQARAIPRAQAVRMLARGFVDEVVGELRDAALRPRLLKLLHRRLDRLEGSVVQ